MGAGTCLDVRRQVESCKAAGPVNLLCAQLPYDPLRKASKRACNGLDLPLTCSRAPHSPQALSAADATLCQVRTADRSSSS